MKNWYESNAPAVIENRRQWTIEPVDCLTGMQGLPDASLHTVVTSPAYWKQRVYGDGPENGREACLDCGHAGAEDTGLYRRNGARYEPVGACGQCYLCVHVREFRELRRVLRPDGVLWLNIGDKFESPKTFAPSTMSNFTGSGTQLAGVPWRLALALQRDGWNLRSDVVWAKRDPIPGSYSDRCITSHEYVFQLTPSKSYYFDDEAIKEPAAMEYARDGEHQPTMRKRRDVWWLSTAQYKGDHFACFPEDLVDLCILASTSARGCCGNCGAQWVRQIHKDRQPTRPAATSKSHDVDVKKKGNKDPQRHVTKTYTTGWLPGCACYPEQVYKLNSPHNRNAPTVPALTADIYAGAASAAIAAITHGRRHIGFEIKPETVDQALARIRIDVPKRIAKLHKRRFSA